MATERYFVGPRLLGDMRDTISRVQGEAYSVTGGHLPGRPEGMPAPGEDNFRMATFTGAWGTGTDRTVTLYSSSSTTETLVATNVLIPVPSLSTPTICAIAFDRGTWNLIQVAQTENEYLTDVTLQPTRLQFGRRRLSGVSATIVTTGITITECENEAASAEQLNFFFR